MSSIPAHKRPDICKQHSCKLNKCLFETNSQMGRCDHHLNDMIECCRKWREQAFSCEGFMWMFKDKFTDDSDSATPTTTPTPDHTKTDTAGAGAGAGDHLSHNQDLKN